MADRATRRGEGRGDADNRGGGGSDDPRPRGDRQRGVGQRDAGQLATRAYARVFERSPEPHFVERLDGTIVDVNEAAARLHGWTRAELIGQSYRVTVADEPAGIGEEAIRELLERGSFRRETIGLRRDGSRFPAEVVAVRLSHDLSLVHVADLSTRAALEAAARQLGDLGRLGDQPFAPEAVAEDATRILVASFGATAGALVTFEDDRVHWRATIGSIAKREALGRMVVPSRTTLLRRVFASMRAEAIDLSHPQPNPTLAALLTEGGVRTLWLLPVLSGDEHRGVLALMFASPPTPETFDAPRLGAIGRVVGTALHNAYLRDEMRRELERRGVLEASARLADVVVRQAHDPVIVTDPSTRIRTWNTAAERVYGLAAADVLGRSTRDVLTTTDLEGSPIESSVRRDTREGKPWRGRVLQRPTGGRREGDEIVVDSVMTALRDETGRASGLVAVNRDVTATARLEAELATLGSLAVETERARSRNEVAEGALTILRRATAAEAGLILAIHGERYEVIGRAGLSDATIDLIAGYERMGTRLSRALRGPTAVVITAVADSPLRGEIAAAIETEGISTILFVGLRVRGELEGLLGLGWSEPPAARPSNEAILQAAALVASGIANARLLERVERGYGQERVLTARLETLVGLTLLPDVAGDERTLSEELLTRISAALGAGGGIVVRVVDDRLERLAGPRPSPAYEALRTVRAADDWEFVRRLKAGAPAFVERIDRETVSPASYAASLAAGHQSYAAFPIRDGERLDAIVLVFFGQSVDELLIDERTLEAIGRVVQIAFANQRLRRTAIASEERYRTLFEESPDALTLQDPDGRILDVNRAAERMYRTERGQLIGRDSHDFVVTERRLDDERGTEVWRAIGRRADGGMFPQEVIVSQLEVDGRPCILARIRDLSEQEQLQQELVQAQKMEAIGQLVSGVAHELNNPIAAIIAFSQLIRRDERLPDDLKRDADLLVGEADRTRRIVQNLLDFARQRRPERHPTSLRLLVQSVLELQAYSLNVHHISTELDIGDAIPLVELDRAQMQQVLLNLVQNAIHAIRGTREPGTIRVAARTVAPAGIPSVRLTISDTGPGVAPEHRDLLFDPFFTTKEPGEGTGLGLPVSFGIVAAHDGQLTFEPGARGATFAMTLPIAAAAPAARDGRHARPDEPLHVRPRGGGARAGAALDDAARRRVLVLDDEPSIRAFLRKALPAAGFDTDVSADGAAAIDLVREHDYAVVLCDYRMAGMSGTEVYDALVSIRPALAGRFVFMSGDVLSPELATFAEQHDVALLAKPFDLETVQRLVRSIAERDDDGAAQPEAPEPEGQARG